MDPIINPWTIFWLQALINLDKLNQFAFFIILFLDALWLFNFIVIKDAIDKYNSYLEVGYKELNYTSMSKEEEYLNAKKEMDLLKKFKIPLIVLSIFSFLCIIFIPSKEMMIAIIASSYVTPDNINAANEVFKANLNDYVNIIADAIKK
jgi:hypothetical protein|nr:MAG TPA: hypothetical protein [Caudoviricetes sp.]